MSKSKDRGRQRQDNRTRTVAERTQEQMRNAAHRHSPTQGSPTVAAKRQQKRFGHN
ncbi:hypothetical protein [Streptomyces sp. NPDC005438]|uniref:hypothetical protein n=1 Tax=Streptomyces sp. NPDC005438 TaxID=3156880 RepID=UPI0033BA0426